MKIFKSAISDVKVNECYDVNKFLPGSTSKLITCSLADVLLYIFTKCYPNPII